MKQISFNWKYMLIVSFLFCIDREKYSWYHSNDVVGSEGKVQHENMSTACGWSCVVWFATISSLSYRDYEYFITIRMYDQFYICIETYGPYSCPRTWNTIPLGMSLHNTLCFKRLHLRGNFLWLAENMKYSSNHILLNLSINFSKLWQTSPYNVIIP